MRSLQKLPQLDFRMLWYQFGAVTFPVLLAFSLTRLVPPTMALAPLETPSPQVTLKGVEVASTAELSELFARQEFEWPPVQAIPALGLLRMPQDFSRSNRAERKGIFFRALLPLVVAENRRVREQRQWLLELVAQEGPVDESERGELQKLAQEYGLESWEDEVALLPELLLRVDELPPALVLAQAALESGWGTSRFVREANNLFGEWTYKAEHGIAPRARDRDSRHYIRRFENLRHSVRSYLNNLNISRAYKRLREMRAKMRAEGRRLDALVLAGGLKRYSARGDKYIEEVRTLIVSNNLNVLGPMHLARLATVD